MTSEAPGLVYLDKLLSEIPENSHVLELGMGPGKDMDILTRHYRMTGSDISEFFLSRYREVHPDSDLILLDAVKMEFPENHRDVRYDGIVSNKVLVHLSLKAMAISLERQSAKLLPGGKLCHSLWVGEGTENYEGLPFTYWKPESLENVIPGCCRVLSMTEYREETDGDSILLILEKKN